jgi:YgiT-type zinc finger domain-containing protein
MITRQTKSNQVCEKCGSHSLKARRTTYPIILGEKTINIERLSVKECTECHHQHPTPAGKEKIGRCIMTMMRLFDR